MMPTQKIPIMEFNGEEFEVLEKTTNNQEPIEPIEEEEALNTEASGRPLKGVWKNRTSKWRRFERLSTFYQEQGIGLNEQNLPF